MTDALEYTVRVETRIEHSDGSLFWIDRMQFFANEEMKGWLAGSCKRTAFWLIALSEATGESYTLKYQTLITLHGEPVADGSTPLLEFTGLTYGDVIKFQLWALYELREMIMLYNRQHIEVSVPVRRRSKLKAIAGLFWQFIRLKKE